MAEPTITFGAAQSFGAQIGWKEQSSSVNVVSDRARVLDKDGNQAASKLYNERTDVSTPYEAGAVSDVAIPDTIGSLVGAYINTGIDIATSATGFATMSLSGHNHSANAHVDDLKTGAHGISESLGFGAVDFLGGTAGANADVESSTLSITCEHNDQEANTGNHLVGENYDGQISVTVVWNGIPTTPCAAGWDKVTVVTDTTNTGFLKTTVSAMKAFSLA